MSEDKKIKVPGPFKIEMDFTLFSSIKYNRDLKDQMHEYDIKEFASFKKLLLEFSNKLKEGNPTAFSDLSALMSMWGYHRKYCGMCGRPVIGKIYRLQGGKIVCSTCHASYKITDKLFEKDVNDEINKENEVGKKLISQPDNDTQQYDRIDILI